MDKKDTFYFPHDYGARNDPKLSKVLMKHGHAGKGIFWDLIEMMYEQGGSLKLSECEDYAFALRADVNILSSLINDFGLFQIENDIFFSESINRRLKFREEKSEKAELRRVAHNMMPESLLKLSLDDALVDYCQQVTDSGALNVHYQSFGVNDIVLDEPVKIGVYRITQELINNVVKHAGAKNAIVQITLKEEVLGITVEDDGSGFDPANLLFVDGMGYKNLKSRVDFLKGNIDVKSERGKGTSVLIQLPV